MPSTENISKLIAHLQIAGQDPEHPDLGFNMSAHHIRTSEFWTDQSGHNCGTVACICGWANHLIGSQDPTDDAAAAEFLGLSEDNMLELFYPGSIRALNSLVYDATPAQAVRVLEILRDEGIIDWDRAFAEVPST